MTKLDTLWTRLFTDLESTGTLRGGGAAFAGERPAVLNAQVQMALTKGHEGPVTAPTLLRAAWALVLARHTSSGDVAFLSSFEEQKPWLGLVRTTVRPKVRSRPGWPNSTPC